MAGRRVKTGGPAGAPSAIEFASRYPDRTSALVLVVPRTYDPENQVGVQPTTPNKTVIRLFENSADFPYWAATKVGRKTLVRFFGVDPALEAKAGLEDREKITGLLADMLPLSARADGIMADTTSELAQPDLEGIRYPTLVISAEDDLYHTLPGARFAAEHIPDATLKVFETGGHLLISHSNEVRGVIADFLSQHNSGNVLRSGKKYQQPCRRLLPRIERLRFITECVDAEMRASPVKRSFGGVSAMIQNLSRGKITAVSASLSAAMFLWSCMTATPYQPEVKGQRTHGGYSEQRLASNRFRVTFDGNMLTSRERVEGYLLYRAAELTVQEGFDWFRIVDRETDRDRRIYIEPSPFYRPRYGYVYWRPYWRYYRPRYGWQYWYPYDGDPFWADTIDVRAVEEFEAHAEIEMARGIAPNEKNAFDARKVREDLEPSIERPKER